MYIQGTIDMDSKASVRQQGTYICHPEPRRREQWSEASKEKGSNLQE